MNFIFLVTVVLTALIFVGLVVVIANAIAPRSYNPQKMEPYECGIPTRGKTWMQFHVGYYLFAILFLMFEVETVFLFPWAVSGSCIRLEERSIGMEVTKRPKIKSIPYEEFQDNETLEKLIQELNAGGANVMVGALDDLIDWGRSNSLWPLTFATSCCGIEFMAVASARYDMARLLPVMTWRVSVSR